MNELYIITTTIHSCLRSKTITLLRIFKPIPSSDLNTARKTQTHVVVFVFMHGNIQTNFRSVFETFKVVKNGPFFKQKLLRAGAQRKKIESAHAPTLDLYCEAGGTQQIRPGGKAKSALKP